MRYDILGVTFDNVTLAEALARAKGFLDEDGPHTVVTPNAEIVYQVSRNPSARDALNAAALVLPDGVGILRAADTLGLPICERVAGIDFAQALLPILADRKEPVFFLGAGPGVAAQAAQNMAQAHPGLTVCGVQDGYYRREEEADVVDRIAAAGAKVVFVCLGAPRQELFMKQYGDRTGARLLVGLGGTFDVWAGHVNRAPKLFIRLGLEWFYRLLRQPSRFGRIMKLPAFLRAVRRQKAAQNK